MERLKGIGVSSGIAAGPALVAIQRTQVIRFPISPDRVTRELGPGLYALEGMKFSMTGWWDMRLAIRAGDATDTAVFNVIVTDTGIQR